MPVVPDPSSGLALGATTQLFSTPYLTLAEWKNAPTAVDSDNLIPGGDAGQNNAELTNLIARASSWMDAYCRQTLSATVDTWATRCRIGRDGMLRVHPRYFPIREVTSLAFGASPDAMNTVSLNATVWIEQRRVIVPASLVGGAALASSTFPRPSAYGRTLLCRISYVNGYPNTTLTADVTGGTSLPVKDATGILPGDTLGVYDDTNGIQTAVVANTWTPTTGAATVPVTTAVTATSGISVSGLPPAVKQAAVFAVTALLKDRGSASIAMRSALEPDQGAKKQNAGQPDIAAACDILTDFRRVTWAP